MVEPVEPPFPPFVARHLLHHLDESVPAPAGFDSWDAYWKLIGEGEGTLLIESPDTVVQGNKCTAVWTREDEDVATVGVHVVLLSGTECVPFDDGAFTRVETNLTAMWDAMKGAYDPSIALDRFEWHKFGVAVRRPNPRVRETIIAGGHPGTDTAGTQLPPQVAVSVTFKTARRKTWGRVYMPAPTVRIADAGRVASGFTDDMRTAWGTLLDDQADHSSPVVIWSPRHAGGPLQYGAANHAANLDNPDDSSFAFTVDSVQVDDLFDVTRSRRYDKATHKATHAVA